MCVLKMIGGAAVRYPAALPLRGWSHDRKGYLIYTSRRITAPVLRRGTRMHRAVILGLIDAGPLRIAFDLDYEVHHMDFDKGNNCPTNLLFLPACFNPSPSRRDPYTGEFMSPAEFDKRYGTDEVPF